MIMICVFFCIYITPHWNFKVKKYSWCSCAFYKTGFISKIGSEVLVLAYTSGCLTSFPRWEDPLTGTRSLSVKWSVLCHSECVVPGSSPLLACGDSKGRVWVGPFLCHAQQKYGFWGSDSHQLLSTNYNTNVFWQQSPMWQMGAGSKHLFPHPLHHGDCLPSPYRLG